MHCLGINGEVKSGGGQLANLGTPVKLAIEMACVCDCGSD